MDSQYSSIAGVVLGAGTSSRFNGNKLTALIDGRPTIGHVVDAALASRLGRVVVVLGHESEDVERVLGARCSNERIGLVHIANYADGQSRSVIAGLRSVQSDFTAAMYLMGDQPFLTSQIIDLLISAFEKSEATICHPTIDGMRRNPVVFDAAFFPEILTLEGDTGARAILEANRDQALAIPFGDELPFLDMDTVAQYRKMIRTIAGP